MAMWEMYPLTVKNLKITITIKNRFIASNNVTEIDKFLMNSFFIMQNESIRIKEECVLYIRLFLYGILVIIIDIFCVWNSTSILIDSIEFAAKYSMTRDAPKFWFTITFWEQNDFNKKKLKKQHCTT